MNDQSRIGASRRIYKILYDWGPVTSVLCVRCRGSSHPDAAVAVRSPHFARSRGSSSSQPLRLYCQQPAQPRASSSRTSAGSITSASASCCNTCLTPHCTSASGCSITSDRPHPCGRLQYDMRTTTMKPQSRHKGAHDAIARHLLRAATIPGPKLSPSRHRLLRRRERGRMGRPA